jgi:hypothetical protein
MSEYVTDGHPYDCGWTVGNLPKHLGKLDHRDNIPKRRWPRTKPAPPRNHKSTRMSALWYGGVTVCDNKEDQPKRDVFNRW